AVCVRLPRLRRVPRSSLLPSLHLPRASTLFPYTTLFRSDWLEAVKLIHSVAKIAIGVKSSVPKSLSPNSLFDNNKLELIEIVLGERDFKYCQPTSPPPPGLLITLIFCSVKSFSIIIFCTARAVVSHPPPGEAGATISTVSLGNCSFSALDSFCFPQAESEINSAI